LKIEEAHTGNIVRQKSENAVQETSQEKVENNSNLPTSNISHQ